jgi:hypothetical protein
MEVSNEECQMIASGMSIDEVYKKCGVLQERDGNLYKYQPG